MELGGNITLSGFDTCDFTQVIVVKKLVGQYARKLHDTVTDFSHLSLTLKTVGTGKFEIHVKCEVGGKVHSSEVTGHNLFIVLDAALKKVVAQVA